MLSIGVGHEASPGSPGMWVPKRDVGTHTWHSPWGTVPRQLEAQRCSWVVHLQGCDEVKGRRRQHGDERDHHAHLPREAIVRSPAATPGSLTSQLVSAERLGHTVPTPEASPTSLLIILFKTQLCHGFRSSLTEDTPGCRSLAFLPLVPISAFPDLEWGVGTPTTVKTRKGWLRDS